jgi:hypothetical protein
MSLLAMKKVKHRLVEKMNESTADSLGLSRAVLVNGKLITTSSYACMYMYRVQSHVFVHVIKCIVLYRVAVDEPLGWVGRVAM